MAIEVNIDGEAINAAVTQAVVDAVIGEQMTKAINDALKSTGFGRPSAVEQVVSQEVQKIIRDVLETDYAEEIREAVKAAMIEEGVAKIASASVQALMAEIEKARSRF